MIKSLWVSIQGNPTFMRKLNGWATIFWLCMLPVSLITGLVNSVGFISLISIYALVTGHWSTFQAARVEERQDDDDTEETVERVEKKVDKIKKKV